MRKYVLLTGATGLVGQYLVRDLLLGDHRVAVIVRPSKKASASERVEATMQMWEAELGKPLERPVVLEGDVTQPGLGLSTNDREWVQANCDRMLHNAATLQFFGPDRAGEPWRTNVQGTQHVLDFCRELGILDLHYVSTAYVCGTREGTIAEEELDCGQGFRNDYEHSKLLAEKMVQEADFLKRVTIYRPAVIAGDSATGYTTTYHGLYVYLKMIALMIENTEPDADGVRDIPIRLDMTGDEPRNIVPVEWVSQVICRLLDTPAAWGHVYHLAPCEQLTPRQVTEFAHKRFNSRGDIFARNGSGDSLNEIDQLARDTTTTYKDYEVSDPQFERKNLLRFTSDLPCPPIDEDVLARYWNFAEQDKWGKRRQPKPEVEFCVGSYLKQRIGSTAANGFNRKTNGNGRNGNGANGNGNGHAAILGLNVLGPGGGQWKLRMHGGALSEVSVGLPHDDAPVLQMTVEQFQETAGGTLDWRKLGNNGDSHPLETGSKVLDALFATS